MVELRETFADVTNIGAQGRADINRPSATPTSQSVAQAQSQAEQATIAAILANPKNYSPKELLQGSNRIIAAKLRAFAMKQEAMAAEQRRLGSFGKSGFASEASQKARNLRQLATDYDRDNVPVNMASAERLIKELHPGGIQAERRENLAAKALGLRKPNPRPRTGPVAQGPEVYEVTDAQGKKWRSSNVAFLERKTGVDVKKVTPGTIVLRDTKTGAVYYGREQTIRGKKKVLAVGKAPPKNARTTKVNVKTARQTSPIGQRTAAPGILPVGDVGSNITQLPPGTDTGFKGDFFLPKIDERTGKPLGTVTPTEEKKKKPTDFFFEPPGIKPSATYSDLAAQAAAKGSFAKEAVFRTAAFGSGLLETRKQVLTDPVGFFAEPIIKPKETLLTAQEQLRVNPTGLFGQLALSTAVGVGVGKGVKAVRVADAKTVVGGELAKAKTVGTEFVFDDAGGFVTKATDTTVKVGGREFGVTSTAQEAFGVGPTPALLPEGARPALRIVQRGTEAPKAPFTAGTGEFKFSVTEKGQTVASGVGETGLAGIEAGGFDLFARTAKATVETAKGAKQTAALEVGALKEGLYAEVKGKGITEASGLVEGRSTTVTKAVLPQDFFTTDPKKFLQAEGVKISEVPSKEILKKGYFGVYEPVKKKVTLLRDDVFNINTGERILKKDILRHEAIHAEIDIKNPELYPEYTTTGLEESFVLSQEANPQYRFLLKEPTTKPVKPTVSSKNLVIEGATVTKTELPSAFLDPRSSAGSTFDIISGDPRKVARTKFLTRESVEPSQLDFVSTPELPPAFSQPKPKAPSVSSGLVQKTRTVTKPSQVLKTAQAQKAIIGETVGQVVGETTKTPTVFGVVTTTKPVTTAFTEQVIKPLTEVSPLVETVSKPIVETATKPSFKLVQVDKLAAALEINTESRAATRLDQLPAQELAQPQKTTQASRVAQIARMTQAQRATSRLGGGAPPVSLFTPTPVVTSSLGLTTTRRGRDLFSVAARRRGVFETVGTARSEKAAALLGRGVVEGSAAASFAVTGPRGVKRDVSRFLPATFRKSKVDTGVFVQKRGARITSLGEKEDITAKGLFALRKKRRGLFA